MSDFVDIKPHTKAALKIPFEDKVMPVTLPAAERAGAFRLFVRKRNAHSDESVP